MQHESKKKELQCGSCQFLVRDRVFEERCSDMGKIPVSKSCGSHSPDVFALVGSEEKIQNIANVADMMSRMGTTELQILGALMFREKNTRKFGYKFHQKVYIRIQGSSSSNYLSNFAVGYVLDVTKETIRVIGESGRTAVSAINERDSETIYTTERFSELRAEMVANKKYTDPSIEQTLKRGPKFGSVRTFDEAIEDDIISNQKIRKQGVKDDLVSLVARLGKGHLKQKVKAIPETESVKINWEARIGDKPPSTKKK